jgi:hypothetical protein
VNVDNFVRAESDRMFRDIQREAGGVNQFGHNRTPTAIGKQTVIRMNRDTLYSFAVVNLGGGATLVLPDSAGRYLSAMILNNDHFVTAIHHEAGEYHLNESAVGTQFAVIAVRILVDPNDAADIAQVSRLQDQLSLRSEVREEFKGGDYDVDSLNHTRDSLLALAGGLRTFDGMFGAREEVDPIHHLIGTAAGWGGLPTSEAVYVGGEPPAGDGDYELRMKDVPVDGFWSISVYNAAGYFEENRYDTYTVNSVTAEPDPDSSVTVRFTTRQPTGPNSIWVPQNWNYLVRLYQPTEPFFDGGWRLPELSPAPDA